MAAGIRTPGGKTMKTGRTESSSPCTGLKVTENNFLTERAQLETRALWLIVWLDRKQLELGQTFILLKAKCKHGGWQNYYRKTFGHTSVSFRTAERYMKFAAKAAVKAHADSLSILKPGTDQHAVNIHEATERARAETGVSTEQKAEQVYRLALHLSEAQRDATILLWQSPDRPRAEREVVAVLERCLIESGLISS